MNISLIGMMGSGKTTTGKMLASMMPNFSFIDTDEEIIKKEKKSINDIFAEKNEAYFRKTESEILFEILKQDNIIISTGGGIVKSEDNIKLLKEKSITVYLKAESYTLYERVKNNSERPLLKGDNKENKIKILLEERSKLYEQAHIIIDTTNKKADIIAEEIIRKINSYGTN